jgi:LemA protein
VAPAEAGSKVKPSEPLLRAGSRLEPAARASSPEPERGAQSPSENERGWGPASMERSGWQAVGVGPHRKPRKKMPTNTHVRSNALIILLAALTLSGCSYNRFTGSEEAIKTQWAQVQNQLQRRNDLIPNLVETTKAFAQQEKDVFTAVAASREKLAGARTPEDTIKAANEQSSALARLLVVVENYPQLKSDATFIRLMDELSGTENRLAVERMRYNERVQEYNTLRRRFPSNVTAKVFGFKEYPYFEAPPAAQQVPKVDFGR